MKTRLIAFLIILAAVAGGRAECPAQCDSVKIAYKLHGQTRRFNTSFCRNADGSITMSWDIVRNLKTWRGSYTMTAEAVAGGNALSFLMPEDGNHVTLPANETFALLSRRALAELDDAGHTTINGIRWTRESAKGAATVTARDDKSGACMAVLNNPALPLITSMSGNPLEINWSARRVESVAATPRRLIEECPERSGGIYYAYPVTADIMPEIPDGYSVSFISHYGRHGSRWLIKTWEYDEAVAALDSAATVGGLTTVGVDALRRLRIIAEQARGNKGALSPLGERQHRGIAERMYRRFPALFNSPDARVEAYSSIEPRCIMSMAAFSERLKEINTSLVIQRHASPGDMRFISYSNPDEKAVNSDDAPWWQQLWAWRDSVIAPERLMTSLFTDPAGVPDPVRLSWILHDIAVDAQDVEPGVELLDLFTPQELYDLWTCLNYKMYYLHGNNPATGSAGPRSAAALLRHFVADIDSAVVNRQHTATLRFGHDTALLRLMALMNIGGADASIASPGDYADGWQDFNLTPMAANLQVILLTSPGAEPLVLIRHNERPATLPLDQLPGGYYRWADVKALWTASADRAEPIIY